MDEGRDLLIEIGTEELPPTALQRLSESFREGFADQLSQHCLSFSEIEPFATPRRLALLVRRLAVRQPDREVVRKGPALKAAMDAEGKPTKAAEGFARSCGVSVKELRREETPKGTWLVFRQAQQGKDTAELVIDMTAKALETLPIPKRMRWGDGDDEFVRPVHWVTMLFGRETIEGKLFGIDVDNSTRGHRFHSPQSFSVPSAVEYAGKLRTEGKVEPRFAARRDMVRGQVQELAAKAGGLAIMEDDLLDEVTALCEWPSAIMGAFDEGFLQVPPEVLVEAMQKHQKYFPVVSTSGDLLPNFITVSNVESRDPSQVRAGNERVIRPRFADAAFFWQQDLKQPLEDFAPRLGEVVFQEKLGTLADKAARVGLIARHIAGLLGMDQELAARAAKLAKCDLVTQMIFEFPALQGTMGRYYAERAGEDPCVASAMEQQYLPRHAGDKLPQSDCGLILAVADRLDTLVGIFAVGHRPTGVKDPYALRRATIGLLRILIETPLPLDLKELLEFSADELKERVGATSAAQEVFDYSMERLKAYYEDKQIRGDVIDSVIALECSDPSDIHRRILAVESFRKLPEAQSLTAANKRIRNILRKTEQDVTVAPNGIEPGALREVEEKRLAERVAALESVISPLLRAQDYQGVLKTLAGLRGDIDSFFDQVMVMSDDLELRRNRLALLQAVEDLFLKVADISMLR